MLKYVAPYLDAPSVFLSQNYPLLELSYEQEWMAKAKLIRCPAPLPETVLNPMLTRMLEVAPSVEGEGGNQGATVSAKEVVRKGRIKNSPD